MEAPNHSPHMTKYVIQQNVLQSDPLFLIDVGASGGIAPQWKLFGNCFKAVGFEPLIAECEKLNATNEQKNQISYQPYFIVSDDELVHKEAGSHSTISSLFEKSSAAQMARLRNINREQQYFNSGKPLAYSEQSISLDNFFLNYSADAIDFIKIDTDGHDFEVLDGAKHILENHHILGIAVECQLHGNLLPYSNTFRNIDKLLTDTGFYLFDFRIYRYARQDLPTPFVYRLPAQTVSGQVMWGDALYLRDYTLHKQSDISPTKLIKLACLYEMYGLPDCSAELLNSYRSELTPLIDVTHCLNLLVKNLGVGYSYQEYMNKFNKNPESFYPK